LENTTGATDLSVNGAGLFMVSDPSTNINYYTRAGQFEWDNEGNLVNPDGFIVQGYAVDPTTGNIGTIGDISLPNGSSEPNPTSEISFGLNLDSNADPSVPDTFTSSITTYDSLGSEVILDVNFTRVTDGWDWTVSATPTSVTCDTNGQIRFTATGELDTTATQWREGTGAWDSSTNPSIELGGLAPAATPQTITWNYMDGGGNSDGSITGYASESSKTAQSQDGYPSGSLQAVNVDEDGYFTGIYSNGSMLPFALITLADFASYSGLAKQGSNLYSESLASGQALLGAPNTASLGAIAPSTLEMSNVDMATEFVEMITTQRAYQANSKVITTSDEILQELINIKR
jgi:flagellar hook protein FlgE